MDEGEEMQEVLRKAGLPSRRDIVAAIIAGGLVGLERMESVPRERQVMERARRMADMLIDDLDSGNRG